MLRSLSFSCLLFAACAGASAPAAETLPRLREALNAKVSSPEENKRNSALVEQVAEDELLQGMTRDEVAQQLGKGEPCSRHPLCDEQGFLPEDWYFEVGEMGDAYTFARPVLIVGFDQWGKVARTYNVRIE